MASSTLCMNSIGLSPSLAVVATGGGGNVLPCASKKRFPITGLSTLGNVNTTFGAVAVVPVLVVVAVVVVVVVEVTEVTAVVWTAVITIGIVTGMLV